MRDIIKTYFRERYGGVPENSNNGTVELAGATESKGDLF